MIEAETTSGEKNGADTAGFKKQGMVNWYSPVQLANTGLRAVMSGIFGNYADKREIQAALAGGTLSEEPVDYSERGELWIDYVSDLGSGWNSTYSIAYLLGRRQLEVRDRDGTVHDLKRGNLLVMGGDEVYPTATPGEYRNRLVGPYRASLSYVDEQDDPPSLFAIPGNHDWYDGLASFLKQFCQQRWIGGWKTRQSRSYFAVKLPHDWWLWGIDIQLHADIDKPQIDYFDRIYEKAADGDRIILCTAEPAWVYQEYMPDDKPYRNLRFFTDRYTSKDDKKLNIRLILSGDMHHYTSFKNSEKSDPDWKITAGGGGAFMHPTHHVPTRLNLEGEGRYERSAAYPDEKTSHKLAWNNLRFPFINLSFGALFGVLYLLFGWFVSASGSESLVRLLADSGISRLGQVARSLGELLASSPGLVIFLLLLFVGITAFADTNRKRALGSRIAGMLHGAIQVVLLLAAVWLCFYTVHGLAGLAPGSVVGVGLSAAVLALCGWLFSGFAMGFYLMIATLLLKTHETEAFSSFRGEDYKNFVRMHLNRDGLTIYPVQVPRACRQWQKSGEMENGEEPWFRPGDGCELDFGLIERPITIPTRDT